MRLPAGLEHDVEEQSRRLRREEIVGDRAVEEQDRDLDQISLRLDHQLTPSDQLLARFSTFDADETLTLPTESPVSDVVRAAILDTGYEASLRGERTDEAEGRLENLQELVNAAVDYDEQGLEGLREFIDHSALVSDQDQYKRDAPVTLMTVHSAKGLEFPLVFICGLEDGLFPHSRSATDPAELEEERRLAYVAMTRAERFLYVTHAMKRRVYGEELASEPSQFLNEMRIDLLEDLSLGKSWLSFARGSTLTKSTCTRSASGPRIGG